MGRSSAEDDGRGVNVVNFDGRKKIEERKSRHIYRSLLFRFVKHAGTTDDMALSVAWFFL